MRILLDTHIFLWLVDDDKRLSDRYRQIIHDLDNEIFLSVVSIILLILILCDTIMNSNISILLKILFILPIHPILVSIKTNGS